MNCLACLQSVCNTELLVCMHCRGSYHHNCVNMTSAQYRSESVDLKKTWACPPCNNVTNRRMGAENTPVRSLHQQNTKEKQQSSLGPSDNSICDSLRVPVAVANMSCDESLLEVTFLDESSKQDKRPEGSAGQGLLSFENFAKLLDAKLYDFKLDINDHFGKLVQNLKSDFNNNFGAVLSELNALKNDMAAATERIKDLEQENMTLRAELVDSKTHNVSSCDTTALHETVNSLNMELNDSEQASLLNDIEVSGVPEFKGESCISIILSVAKKLGVELVERDVVSVRRVGRWDEAATRPRPLVARLARRTLCDQLIKGSRVRRGASTVDMGLPVHEPQSFYVNERLTKTNRILLGKAKDLRQTYKWKYSWTNEGRVFVRETDKSNVYLIRVECDLNRVFKVSAIPETAK